MDYQAERLGLIVELAEQSMDIVQRFANDPMGAGNIQTGSGPIKNLKQVSADIKSDGEAAVEAAVTELIDTLKTETSVNALIDGLTDAAALAEANADRAVVAADSANALGKIYDSTAIGLLPANTAPGQYFSVPAGPASETLILYQNVAGAAIEKKRYPSVEAVRGSFEGITSAVRHPGQKVAYSRPMTGRYGTVSGAVAWGLGFFPATDLVSRVSAQLMLSALVVKARVRIYRRSAPTSFATPGTALIDTLEREVVVDLLPQSTALP